MKWVGWKGSIIIDEVSRDFFQGRNYAYKPIFIRKGESGIGTPQLGDRLLVRIKKYSSRALEGVELG
jgi:hypothetical protein